TVDTAEGLRPTPDRIRETLFNWLTPCIAGARCLDLFAGTGALGLEALSRGAAHVTFIDNNAASVQTLRDALATLDCHDADIQHGDALKRAALLQTGYDVIFVDPPFAAHLHAPALAAIRPLVKENARVYLEYPAAHADAITSQLSPAWQLLRSKRAGQVGYCLVTGSEGRS